MKYNYYEFEEPIKCLLIATDSAAALLEYHNEVANTHRGVSFEQISQEDCLDRLAQRTTDEMPTIEYGLSNAALDIQESLFCIAEAGKEAIVLDISRSLTQV